jgi:hypothetical protein
MHFRINFVRWTFHIFAKDRPKSNGLHNDCPFTINFGNFDSGRNHNWGMASSHHNGTNLIDIFDYIGLL